ncbi:MAG: TetR family transcriptional regulator C-terminal domain-containing protein [Opitutales bacterium]
MSEHEHVIIDAYIDYVLEEGHEPPSVYTFCKKLELKEADFFALFPSFTAVEKAFWARLAERAKSTLESDPEVESLNARQRMLAWFYALNEQANANRSFVLKGFPGFKPPMVPAPLDRLRERFEAHARTVLAGGVESEEVAQRGRLNDTYPFLFFQQFCFVLDFSVKDDSRGFERTEALIEKSVNLAFDLMERQALESAFDLFRFLAGRAHQPA